MENGTKWEKNSNGWMWNKGTDAYKAEISKVVGTGTGRPYLWDVRRLPRPEGERWTAFAKGSSPNLAEAKAAADETIARLTAPEGE